MSSALQYDAPGAVPGSAADKATPLAGAPPQLATMARGGDDGPPPAYDAAWLSEELQKVRVVVVLLALLVELVVLLVVVVVPPPTLLPLTCRRMFQAEFTIIVMQRGDW